MSFAVEKKIILSVPEYRPFTFIDKKGELKGSAVDIVIEIFTEIGVGYELHIIPNHEKAFVEIKNGKADGVFPASQNKDRDQLCNFYPLFSNKWIWIISSQSTINPYDKDFKKNSKIGVILNTNHQTWLEENNYNIVGTPKDANAALKMLKIRRVDALLMSETVFWNEAINMNQKDFRIVIEGEHPLGIYISKIFLLNNPSIKKKLDDSIHKLIIKE